jgi:hypothetical protein
VYILDILLVLWHAGDVLLEGGGVLTTLGGRVAKELGELDPVLRIIVDSKLDVLAEGLVELGKGHLVLRDLLDISMHFFTRFLRIILRILFCWSISREMLKGRSSESTIPLTKLSHSGMRSSRSSMINTLRT